MHILHILHILHIFPFQCTESFLFKTLGLLDSDDSDPESLPSPTQDLPSPTRDSPVPPSHDSEGPASEAPDQAPLPHAQAQPPRSLPPVDMIQTIVVRRVFSWVGSLETSRSVTYFAYCTYLTFVAYVTY